MRNRVPSKEEETEIGSHFGAEVVNLKAPGAAGHQEQMRSAQSSSRLCMLEGGLG